VERLLGEHGIAKDSAAGRREFEARMELRRAAEDGQEFKDSCEAGALGARPFAKSYWR